MPKKRKAGKFDQKKEVRKLARERIGTVPASRVIEPKQTRRRPKHKEPPRDPLEEEF
ncbi:MAG: hypothetical protein ACRD7E_20625 [Bryobacteraceae bacterium]